VIRVAVAGAAGRMGKMVCGVVEDAEDMQLTGRADQAGLREGVQLPEGSPVLHGCQIVGNQMYFTDDLGWICRFRMPNG